MRRALLLPLLLPIVACTGDEPATSPGVECEGEYEEFTPGMEVRTTQGNFYVALMSADPDPPDEGDNDWVVKLTTESGSAVNGGTVTITPWMPAHGHGISPPNYSGQPAQEEGEYTIPTFDLIMPGVWEFQILVTESMANDTATFSFCLEG